MLRHLSINEMVSLTTVWETNPEAKALFLSIEEIAPIHPKIVEVNNELLAMRPVDNELSVALEAVATEASKVDAVHDALTRAVAAGIEADRSYCLAARPPQRQRAAQLEKVRTALFPRGLSIVNVSYLAEAGNTARLGALLRREPEIAELLASIPVREGGDLLGLTRRWIAAGKKLGRLEHQRNVLAAKDATRLGGPASIAAARARWLRLVSQVLSNLELATASPEAIETIRGPVLRASERAGLRYGGAQPGEPVVDEAVDGEVGEEAGGGVDGEVGTEVGGGVDGEAGDEPRLARAANA